MKVRLTTTEPEAPATMELLEDLKPALEAAGCDVNRDARRIERPGTLSFDEQTIGLVFEIGSFVAHLVANIYHELERRRANRHERAAAAQTASPGSNVPGPITIKVRFGVEVRTVDSAKTAADVDVEIQGLPADREVSVVIEKE